MAIPSLGRSLPHVTNRPQRALQFVSGHSHPADALHGTQAADAAIDTACRLLRLPSIRNEFNDIADRAVKDQMTYRGFLAELLMTECDDRARRRSERRIKAAGFPREKSLRAFDFDANPKIDAATVHTLASCEWIKKSQPLCLIGDSGTGKSHMLIALGTEAAMKGYRVRYMELDRHGAELLFQVLTEQEEKNSVAITSNESPTSPLRGHRRPSHLQRHDHRDRHRLLPSRQHPGPSRRARRQLKSLPPRHEDTSQAQEVQGHKAIRPAAVSLKPQASK
ncbi:hypothetical protein GCM10010387_62070 [Streptomyces inusitatus]|uniref:IstB-like ATP-binding domain-containing protein n=1 Tax=Streptomyces inusitatus TaxID=68221 RepID=A0A918V1Z2_9ACTN|nr:hypothetical protein GCM10010387_62070 [Streptomyces inusitatus]